MRTFLSALAIVGGTWGPVGVLCAQEAPAVTATLSSARRHVFPGQPVWVDFTITNSSDEPVELSLDGVKPVPDAGLVGLPLSHVFSGVAFAGLSIQGGGMGRVWDSPVGYQPPQAARIVSLGPHASVGLALEVSRYYPVLRTSGRFRMTWSPYGGSVISNELIVEVTAPKLALIQTDFGTMTIQFHYDVAPIHVENFLELARSGFYDNLTLHKIVPGYFIQGGCSHGDGTGVRPDGRRLAAELSDLPVKRGTVCMARLEEDMDSASSQFLICASRIPQWDGKYTVFGELIGDESFTTLERMLAEPTSADGHPVEPMYSRSVRIVDALSRRAGTPPASQ